MNYLVIEIECKECQGEGQIYSNGLTGEPVPWSEFINLSKRMTELCPACKGKGYIEIDNE